MITLTDAAATKDLKLYNDLAPDNLIYKHSVFGFVPADSFSALFAEHDRDQRENADGRILQDPMDHLVHDFSATLKELEHSIGGLPNPLLPTFPQKRQADAEHDAKENRLQNFAGRKGTEGILRNHINQGVKQ